MLASRLAARRAPLVCARRLCLQAKLQRDGAAWPVQVLSTSEASELKNRLCWR